MAASRGSGAGEWTLDEHGALTETRLAELRLVSRGKVRDIYELGDDLLIVTTDRISAFDWVLPNGIPDKGKVLNQLSTFWFRALGGIVPNHLRSTDVAAHPRVPARYHAQLAGRSMLVAKAQVFPVECVVRGYLAGSGWQDYRKTGAVCGVPLPGGLEQASQLAEPIFTPATKAGSGHDENIDFGAMRVMVGDEVAADLRRISLALYREGAGIAARVGIIVADTKFEFGLREGQIHIVDEVLTPDSSRFWPAAQYAPGHSPPSYDKQFVRDWLETTPWDKNSPPPRLPQHVVEQTRAKYLEALVRLTGHAVE